MSSPAKLQQMTPPKKTGRIVKGRPSPRVSTTYSNLKEYKIRDVKDALGLSSDELSPVYRLLRKEVKQHMSEQGVTFKNSTETKWNQILDWATHHVAFEANKLDLFFYEQGDHDASVQVEHNWNMLSILCRDADKKSGESATAVAAAIGKTQIRTQGPLSSSPKKRPPSKLQANDLDIQTANWHCKLTLHMNLKMTSIHHTQRIPQSGRGQHHHFWRLLPPNQ
jgi:hypothetical protein